MDDADQLDDEGVYSGATTSAPGTLTGVLAKSLGVAGKALRVELSVRVQPLLSVISVGH